MPEAQFTLHIHQRVGTPVSGDVPAGLPTKALYLVQCVARNCRRARTGGAAIENLRLPQRAFGDIRDVSRRCAPSRFYAEAFWRNLPWERVRRGLGAIDVLELGCGSGSRLQMLTRFLGPALRSYTGVDVRRRPEWEPVHTEDTRATFVEGRAESLPADMLERSNLIISQSVLEHIEHDRLFFKRHAAIAEAAAARAIQVHLVPATASLFTYLWHGYRQYSRAALCEWVSVYGDARCAVVPLGGLRSNLLHFLTITVPNVCRLPQLRDTKPHVYERLLQYCYDRERTRDARCPSCYALVLQHGFGADVLWQ